DRRRRVLDHAGHDRRSGDPRRDRRGGEGEGRGRGRPRSNRDLTLQGFRRVGTAHGHANERSEAAGARLISAWRRLHISLANAANHFNVPPAQRWAPPFDLASLRRGFLFVIVKSKRESL